ncbi:MAG: hypothetical protein CMQ41_09985 [Gammaproteobacteria bacterium]|mgnify:CR=1 FL=1|nr:hypothetical protein [Gammaproteobacteria bacterium]|tara:strand:- start:1701 stop:2231 length:531 start_codon:yes stop_codon:yes gene_type:complete
MRKLFKRLGIIVGAIIIGIAALLFGMRFTDGPIEILTGGPFSSGTLATAPSDWSYLADRGEIEFQTMDPLRSRIVWLAVYDTRLFIVSGYMNTPLGAIWKQWPHYLENDNRIILRIDGNLYEHRLKRIMEGPEVEPVLSELARKYFRSNGTAGDNSFTAAETVANGDTWMFEVVSR